MNEGNEQHSRNDDFPIRVHEQVFHAIMLVYTLFVVSNFGKLALAVIKGELSILYLYALIFLVEVAIVFAGKRLKFLFQARLAALLLTACMSAIWIVQCAIGSSKIAERGSTATAIYQGERLIFLILGLILLAYTLSQSYLLLKHRRS